MRLFSAEEIAEFVGGNSLEGETEAGIIDGLEGWVEHMEAGGYPVGTEVETRGHKSTVDVLNPPSTLLVKLGSIARHAEEGLSETGLPVDLDTVRRLLADPEVERWMVAADGLALLPVRR